jgi:DNA-binding GntR family transcriptional regulator
MSPGDLEELCIARVTLEAQAMRLSVPLMTPEDLARLEGYMAEMAHYAEIEDYRRWTVPHRSFHRALTAPAGERINDLLGQLFDHAERYRRLHIGHAPTPWATAGHREILDAAKAGDRDRSAALLASHFARTGFEVAELLDAEYDPVLLRQTLEDLGAEAPVRS